MTTHALRAVFRGTALSAATFFACSDDSVLLATPPDLDAGTPDAEAGPTPVPDATPPAPDASPILEPMTLDPSFGTGGKTVVVAGGGSGATAMGLVLQSSGALVAGVIPAQADGKGQANLLRLSAAGMLDPAFAGDAGSDATSVIYAQLAIAPGTDQLVVFGSPPDAPGSPVIARFTSAGAPDLTFGTGGRAEKGSGGGIPVVLTNGKILNGLSGGANITRLDATGNLDPTFGGGTGISIHDPITHYEFRAIAPLVDNTMYVGGSVVDAAMAKTCAVLHLANDGAIDKTFGTNGEAPVDKDCVEVSGVFVTSAGLVVQSQSLTGLAFTRLNAAGAVDPSYGKPAGLGGPAANVVKLNDDSFIVLGPNLNDKALEMTLIGPNGTIDRARRLSETWGLNSFMVIQSDGKLVVFGSLGGELVVARYQL